jgi:cobaltochelatase CobS
MANPIEMLQNIVATSTDPAIRENAQKELDRLASIGSAQVQVAQSSGTMDAQLQLVLGAIEKALLATGANVSMADIRKAVNEELEKRKITEADLSPSLLAMLQSNRPVSLTIKKITGSITTKSVSDSLLKRPLMQLILSDLLSRNNVYLYGGAGTGKTFIAEQVAELLGWEKITLNCNQFTSPLDILGGQTIEGYQEGKLSMAWSNEIIKADGSKQKVDGCVLILDELPKIDPNTAGILNEALAKVKDYKYDDVTQTSIPPTIRNGKNEILPLGNLFVIATGNVPLNTIDPDYEANFKQDLSLQDRFIGSTYRVYVDAENEFQVVMKGFAFIWIFLFRLRKAIEDARATGQAFVSLRLMINTKATYVTYRDIMDNVKKSKGNLSGQAISNPKTIQETMDNFFGLFKPSTRQQIMDAVDYQEFKRIIAEKNKMAYNPAAPNFDTPAEIATGNQMVADYKAQQKIN